MLVLSRKKNESIYITDSVRIVVVEIRGDKVRIGVEADATFPVHRCEVWHAIRQNIEMGTLDEAGRAQVAGKLVFVPEGMEAVLRPISQGVQS